MCFLLEKLPLNAVQTINSDQLAVNSGSSRLTTGIRLEQCSPWSLPVGYMRRGILIFDIHVDHTSYL